MAENKLPEKKNENAADFLRKNMAMVESAAKGGVIKPDRILSFAVNSIRNNMTLASCTKGSLLKAVLVSAQLGLVPDNILGEGYLVPFWSNKERAFEAQFVIGYRGLIKLLFQAGFVIDVDPHVVYAGDEFSFCYGLNPSLIHKPAEGEHGEIRGFYAVIRFANGVSKFHYISAHEAQRHGERFSKSKSKEGRLYGPWVDHFEAMALKTVIKQGTKYCPLSVDLVSAISSDEQREQGLVIDIDQPDVLPAAADKKEELPVGGISGLDSALGGDQKSEPPAPTGNPAGAMTELFPVEEVTSPPQQTDKGGYEKSESRIPAEERGYTCSDQGKETPQLPSVQADMSDRDRISDYLAKNYKTPSAKQNRLRKLAASVCQEHPEMLKHIALAGQLSAVNNIPPDLAKAMASEIREMASVPF